MRSHLDHIAVTAPSLASGVDYVRQVLGVTPQGGGEHPRMGTHNRFVKLGERLYLEVIAVNPEAPPPGRPRWFQLDDPDSSRSPRLAAWVAHTDDIHAAAAASPLPLGKVESMSRGQLNWLITIPEDGSIPLHGLAPMLIQWPAGVHPADSLEDSGCSLIRLEGFHPQSEKLQQVLHALGLQGRFSVWPLPPGEFPYLVAHVQTPRGPVKLG